MLRSVLSHEINTSSKKILPHWNQYVSTLKFYRDKTKREYLRSPGYRSRIMTTLAYMLTIVDWDYINKKDDLDAYIDYFQHMYESYAHIFDLSRTGYAYRNLFVKRTIYSPNEYLVAPEDTHHLRLLPWGLSWDSWKEVRCVYMWHHDSSEYTLNLLLDKLQFKWFQPTYCICCIDPIILALKYMKYMQDDTPEEDKGMHKFLHTQVMVELFQDQLDIWLLKQITDISKCNTEDDVLILKNNLPSNNYQYGHTGQRYEEAAIEMFNVLEDVKNRKVRPMEFLQSELLSDGTILDRWNLLHTYLNIAHLTQMDGMRFMMELPGVELLLEFYARNQEVSNYQNMQRELAIQLRRYVNRKIWNYIHDPTIRDNIKTKVMSLYARIQEK